MTSLDRLLRQSADDPPPSPDLVPRVLRAVEAAGERRAAVLFLARTVLVGVSFFLVCLAASFLYVDLSELLFFDLSIAIVEEPSLLLAADGWTAVAQSTPFVSVFFVAMSIALLIMSLRRFGSSVTSLFPRAHAF